MKKKNKLGNQGFSFIEMIVVVAISVILIATVSMGYSVISNKEVDQCAKTLQATLESNRMTAMGKKTASVSFYVSDGKIMVDKETDGNVSTSQIGSDEVVVKYVVKSGTNETIFPVIESNKVKIEFDRASGSLKPFEGVAGDYISEFIVTNTSGNKTLRVKIDKLTGKVSIE